MIYGDRGFWAWVWGAYIASKSSLMFCKSTKYKNTIQAKSMDGGSSESSVMGFGLGF